MSKFWSLLRQSVIVQALLATGCMTTVIYLAVLGRDIPEVLVNSLMLILGFYFGSKSQMMATQSRE